MSKYYERLKDIINGNRNITEEYEQVKEWLNQFSEPEVRVIVELVKREKVIGVSTYNKFHEAIQLVKKKTIQFFNECYSEDDIVRRVAEKYLKTLPPYLRDYFDLNEFKRTFLLTNILIELKPGFWAGIIDKAYRGVCSCLLTSGKTTKTTCLHENFLPDTLK